MIEHMRTIAVAGTLWAAAVHAGVQPPPYSPGWPQSSQSWPDGPGWPTPSSEASWPWPGPWHHPTPTSASRYTSSATASSTSSSTPGATTSLGPCASVSVLASSATVAKPGATPHVPAQLAYECINSVPFNASAAVEYMDSIRPYIDWQTSIEYLKDPPAEYAEKIQPPYDFWANFERIYSKASVDGYASEYAFGFDVYTLFQHAHDGHFVVYPDSVTAIFSYGRTTPLVSVSVDGTSIPEVFVYEDILVTTTGNQTFTPSPLREIDGQDSTEWLLNYSQVGSLQDRDALWNNMFWINAQVSLGSSGTGAGTFAGSGRGRWQYPGPTTTLTFANGTTLTLDNFARVLVPFDGIETGEDIYQTFFAIPEGAIQAAAYAATSTSPATSSTSVASSVSAVSTPVSSSAAATTIPAPGYPSPIIRNGDNQNSGYFLDGEGYDDVAVLSVPSFVGSGSEIDFQAVNTYLINRAVAANKTKLIIDVSANGGGTILQGYDLFKQLFPSILPYGGTRFRAHQAFDLIGQEVSYFSGLVPRSLNTNDTVQDLTSSAYNYRTDADIDYEPFTSWSEKYGPHAYGPGPDNFTSIIRWNLSDVLTPDNSGGIYVSGYLNRTNITAQPFLPENIVIVYDGYCASTCTIFSELMRQQGGVKAIALGGRPNKDIIQAVGGIKGTNDYGYDYIYYGVGIPFTYEYIHSAAYYNTTALANYNNVALLRSLAYVVNARDGIREGDKTETPLQFIYEPADCRIYYTPDMVVDETAVWKTVADTAFNGESHCIAGDYATGGSKKVKRAAAKVAARPDLDLRPHYEGLTEVWTGRGGLITGGDSLMLV